MSSDCLNTIIKDEIEQFSKNNTTKYDLIITAICKVFFLTFHFYFFQQQKAEHLNHNVDYLQIGNIIAIFGYHDAIWFAIVTQDFFFPNDVISINYFEKIVNTNGKKANKYYYLSSDEVTISKNTIICTGITFHPV